MMAITQDEVRRHPRWREELTTSQVTPGPRMGSTYLLVTVAFLIVGTAIGVLLLR